MYIWSFAYACYKNIQFTCEQQRCASNLTILYDPFCPVQTCLTWVTQLGTNVSSRVNTIWYQHRQTPTPKQTNCVKKIIIKKTIFHIHHPLNSSIRLSLHRALLGNEPFWLELKSWWLLVWWIYTHAGAGSHIQQKVFLIILAYCKDNKVLIITQHFCYFSELWGFVPLCAR